MFGSLRAASQKVLRHWWVARRKGDAATGSGVRQILMSFAMRPGRFAAFAIGLFFIGWFILLMLSAPRFDMWAQLFAFADRFIPRTSETNLESFSSSLLQAQAALAALSFPIAIAFAALSQDREQRTTTLEIYFVESAVVLLALSSLALVITTAALPLVAATFHPLGLRPFFNWSIALYLTFWMAINIAVTARFTYKTFQFLGRDGRRSFLTNYAVQAVRSRNMRNQIMGEILRKNVQGWAGKLIEFDAENDPESYRPLVRHFRGNKRLFDVRMTLLRLALHAWVKKSQSPSPVLFSEIDIDRTARSFVCLRYPVEKPLTWWQILLLRRAFVYERASQSGNFHNYEEYVATIVGEARSALMRGDRVDYSYHLESFTQIIRGALHKGYDDDDLSEADRALIDSFGPDGDVWVFLRPARALVNEILIPSATQGHPEWLEEFLRTISEFVVPERQAAAGGLLIVRDSIRFLTYVNIAVEKEWRTEFEIQVAKGLISPSAEYLPHPQRRYFDELLHILVGRWEYTNSFHLGWFLSKASRSDAPALTFAMFEHCGGLARSVLAAVEARDRNAAEWWLDSFVRWLDQFSFAFSRGFTAPSEMWLRSAALLEAAPSDDENERLTEEAKSDSAQRYEVLANFWCDARLVLLAALYREATTSNVVSKLATNLLKSLMSGERLRAGSDHSDEAAPLAQATEVLATSLRIILGSDYEGYILDNMTREALELHKPPMISGRGYSTIGSQDRDANIKEFGALIVEASSSAWREDSPMLSSIYQWLSDGPDRKRDGMGVLGQLSEIIVGLDVSTVQAAFSPDKFAFEEYSRRKKNAKQGIDALLKRLEKDNEQALRDTAVSQARLNAIADAAATTAFSASDGGIVTRLFSNVRIIDFQSDANLNSLRIAAMSKSMVVDVSNMDRAINEEEWLAKTTSTYVSSNLMSQIYNDLLSKRIIATSADVYFRELLTRADELGDREEVLLLTSNQTVPDWVWKWKYPSGQKSDLPEGLKLENPNRVRYSRQIPFLNINGINVVQAPVKATASLLVRSDSFIDLAFEKFEDGRLVKADWSPEASNDLVGVLKLSWKPRPTISPRTAIELIHRVEAPQKGD